MRTVTRAAEKDMTVVRLTRQAALEVPVDLGPVAEAQQLAAAAQHPAVLVHRRLHIRMVFEVTSPKVGRDGWMVCTSDMDGIDHAVY